MEVIINKEIGYDICSMSEEAVIDLAARKGKTIILNEDLISWEEVKQNPSLELEQKYFHQTLFLEHILDTNEFIPFYEVPFIFEIKRNDVDLLEVYKKYGIPSNLKIVEIPDEVEFFIHENDMGIESIHEKHRVWF